MLYKMSRLSRLDVKCVDLFDANHHTFFAEHHNPNYELIVVAEGTVHLEVAGVRLKMSAGESLLLKPWESHGGWKPGEQQGRFFWAQFSCDPDIDEFLLHQASELNIIHASQLDLRTIESRSDDPLVIPRLFRPKQRYKLLGLFEELLETSKKPKGNFRFHATILLAEMLCLISNDWLEHTKLDTAAPTSYLTFRRLLSYLNHYYMDDIPKENLEQFMNRKYEYLCHVFKKYANTNIQHYIHQLRTQRAKYLLQHTSKSVKNIAQEVGYPDPFHFSRTFKKIEGVAPQHYRDSGVHHQQYVPRNS
jgi:AraC-like DNA-binding protein